MLALPQNATCEEFYQNSALGLTGLIFYLAVSKCLEGQEGDSLGGSGGRGVDEFITKVVNEYFTDSKQVMVLYDESWEISGVLRRMGLTSKKSFVCYFLPLDPELGQRVHSKPADHFSHRALPKANAFVVFVKDEHGFSNVLSLVSRYPWWNIKARVLVLVKEKSLEPTKGILDTMDAERIFNGVVVTEISVRENDTASSSDIALNLNQVVEVDIALQIAGLDPYPPEGQSKHVFVARYINGEFSSARQIFIEKIDNLRGFKLRVCTFEFPPLVIKKEVRPGVYDYTGLEIFMLKEFAKNLNFTYEIYEPEEGERYGKDLGNGSWNGLIGEVAENRAQIGFANIFLLDQRELVVDVAEPYDQDRGCFAVPRPEALQHWLGLVLPFSWQVWACFIAMALVAGPIFSLITRPLAVDGTLTIGRGIMYAVGSMISAQHPPKAKSSALRSFIIAWLVFCWLSAIIYRVALIVSLTVGPSDYRIDTLSQLARAGLEWSGYEEILKMFTMNATDKTETQRNDQKTDQNLFDKYIPLDDIRGALNRVAKEGDFAVMDSGKYLKYAANGIYYDGFSSSIHIMKECPVSFNVGFVMPIGSPYTEKINTITRKFQSAGLVEKWLRDIIHEAFLKNPNKRTGQKSYGLSIDHLKLCFVLVLFGNFFAFISLCVETCISNYYKKKEANKSRKNSRISVNSRNSLASSASSNISTDTTNE